MYTWATRRAPAWKKPSSTVRYRIRRNPPVFLITVCQP